MKVNLNKRKTIQGYLFPGERLKQKMPHFGLTPYIGYAFEQMTANLLHGSCLSVNSTDDCCPDVKVKDVLIESKASCRKCFVSGVRQFENYKHLRYEELTWVKYALWEYERTKDRETTVHAALDDCADKVKRLILLDFPLVEMVIAQCPKMHYIRSLRASVAYYRMREASYGPLANEPEKTLADMGVSQYYRVKRAKKTSHFAVDGIKFDSTPFDVLTIEESIPF